MKRTVTKILKNDLCLGCGLCKAVSGESCVMSINRKGFYEPKFESSEAMDCKTLADICPGINVINNSKSRYNNIWGSPLMVANAWSCDNSIRRLSSSGGGISSIAIYLLETNRVNAILHVGTSKENYLHNELCISKTRNDVIRNCSSRYAPASIFDNLKNILDSDKSTYAFIGKPCDIAGLQNFINKYPEYNNRILYQLSIFCAGMPSYNATSKVLATFNKNEEPISVRYRGDGWPGYFTATYADGSVDKMSYNDSWGKILGRELGFRCKICPDGIGLLADISAGDSWNTKDGYPDFTEAEGRNFCFVRTERGKELFEAAASAGYIHVEHLQPESIKEMQTYQYTRRQMVGWRIAAVQVITGGLLRFKSLGHYRNAIRASIINGIRESIGTARRLSKIRKDYLTQP